MTGRVTTSLSSRGGGVFGSLAGADGVGRSGPPQRGPRYRDDPNCGITAASLASRPCFIPKVTMAGDAAGARGSGGGGGAHNVVEAVSRRVSHRQVRLRVLPAVSYERRKRCDKPMCARILLWRQRISCWCGLGCSIFPADRGNEKGRGMFKLL